jgi:hypothetical protein
MSDSRGSRYRDAYLHKVVWFRAGLPDSEIDHIDCDKLNNQRDNLRSCTRTENCRNSRGWSGSDLQVKGVRRRGNSYQARVYVEGRELSLGSYNDVASAASAYDNYVTENFGDFGRSN